MASDFNIFNHMNSKGNNTCLSSNVCCPGLILKASGLIKYILTNDDNNYDNDRDDYDDDNI